MNSDIPKILFLRTVLEMQIQTVLMQYVNTNESYVDTYHVQSLV